MGITWKKKIRKRYMFYCPECEHLSFSDEYCEVCGNLNMVMTPKQYGLTNLACISMSVVDFEAMKDNFVQKNKKRIS